MTRLLSIAASLAASATLLVAASDASAQNAYYVAKPAAVASKSSVITRSTPWTLRDGTYLANRAPERDLVLCQLLARNVGPLRSFSAGGDAFDPEAMTKCNTKARGGAATAVAATTR